MCIANLHWRFSWDAWVAAMFTAVIVLIAYNLGPYPMQLLTAKLTATMLSVFFQVHEAGTILTVAGIEVAVTPDCAGFNALYVLTPFMMSWALAKHINVTAMALAIVPITIFANTVRVIVITCLALFGDLSLAMGKLHSLTGLVTFVLAMMMAIAAGNLWLRFEWRASRYLGRTLAIFCFSLITFYSLRIYSQSPLDAMMSGLLLVATAMTIYKTRRAPETTRFHPVVLGVAGLLTLMGLITSIQLVWLVGILLAGTGLLAGEKPGHDYLPTLFICYLFSLPGLSQFLIQFFPGQVTPLLYVAALLMIALSRSPLGHVSSRILKSPRIRYLAVCIAAFSFAIAMMVEAPVSGSPSRHQEMPYNLSEWSGGDVPLALSEEMLFGGATMTKREYTSIQGAVSVLEVNSSSRSHIHPPQYCYASAGWRLDPMSNEGNLSYFGADKGSDKQVVGYLVEVNGKRYPGSQLLVAKLASSLSFDETHWRLLRVATNADDAAIARLRSFIAALDAKR